MLRPQRVVHYESNVLHERRYTFSRCFTKTINKIQSFSRITAHFVGKYRQDAIVNSASVPLTRASIVQNHAPVKC